jgi:hypothetical protein
VAIIFQQTSGFRQYYKTYPLECIQQNNSKGLKKSLDGKEYSIGLQSLSGLHVSHPWAKALKALAYGSNIF